MDHLHYLINSLDKEKMLEAIESFPRQIKEAYDIARVVTLKLEGKNIQQVVILGMGGSAIGGEVTVGLSQKFSKIPMFINRDYDVPRWVNASTLVVAVSYSGGTEETLSALDVAIKQGAQLLIVSSGGQISDIAKKQKADLITIPDGLQPRAAFGFLFLAQITALWKLGLIDIPLDIWMEDAVKEATFRTHQYSPDEIGGHAYSIARDLHEKIVAVFSGPGFLAPIAARWKGQICENAKTLAYHYQYPEMNHNEIVGWKQNPELLKNIAVVHLVGEDEDHYRVIARMDKTGQMLAHYAGGVYFFHTQGENLLSKIFSLVQLGDYVSYYLALLNNENPTPVEAIGVLKAHLATIR